MNSILTGKKPRKDKYPFLGIAEKGKVVLFSKPHVGVVVHSAVGDNDTVGRYSEGWLMSKFEPLRGEVTLSNS